MNSKNFPIGIRLIPAGREIKLRKMGITRAKNTTSSPRRSKKPIVRSRSASESSQ